MNSILGMLNPPKVMYSQLTQQKGQLEGVFSGN